MEELDETDIQRFLSHLVVDRNVAVNTQNLAFNAVAFLYRELLQRRLDDIQFARVRRPRGLPVVRTPDEVFALLGRMAGVYKLMATLMYGTGMRLMECIRAGPPGRQETAKMKV